MKKTTVVAKRTSTGRFQVTSNGKVWGTTRRRENYPGGKYKDPEGPVNYEDIEQWMDWHQPSESVREALFTREQVTELFESGMNQHLFQVVFNQ